MAKSTPMKLGMADDVLHDVDFQKQLQPELDEIKQQIGEKGLLYDAYIDFKNNQEGNNIEAQTALSFAKEWNNTIDEFINIKDLNGAREKIIDNGLYEYENELNDKGIIKDTDGKYLFKETVDGVDSFVQVDKEDIFLCLKYAEANGGIEKYEFNIDDDDKICLTQNNEIIEVVDSSLDDINSDRINASIGDLSIDDIKEKLLDQKIDVGALEEKLRITKADADKIETKIERAENRSYLSKHNFFKQYDRLDIMLTAKKYDMKFEGGYVTKTEIFIQAIKVFNADIFNGLLEIALYKILDHIESKEDFERYKETGSVDKPESNNDVINSNIDNNNDTVERNSNDATSNTESGTDNVDVINNKDKPDNDKVTVKIGDFEIDKSTKIDLKEGKLNNGDGKSIDIADVKGKIGNIEVSGDTWKNKKDGTDRYGINIVRGQHGEALVKDKIVLEVKGRIEKTGLDDKSAEVLKSGTDKAGNDRYLGIDRDTTVGYVIYDPKADKSEYLDCRFKHIAGEYLGVDNSDLRFSKDQETLQTKDGTDYKLDINIVDKFTDEFIEKISPSDTEIKDKIDSINERITELEEIENKVSLSDDEKSEIDGKISELEDSKNELESFLSSDDNDKTVPERIEMAEHKSEICNSDIEPTKAENDHKDEIEKIKLNKIESKIEIKEKEVETRGIENDKRELSDLRKEYIDNSSLNEEDKATLREAVRDDIKDFDKNISDKEINDKEKCAEVVQKIYGRDIEKNPDAEFKSDICNTAKENVKSEIEAKKEEFEIKKSDIENIKSKYDTEFKITKDYIKDLENRPKDLENRPNTEINKDKDGKIDSITFIEKDTFKSDKSDKEYQVEKTTILTFDNEKLTITSELEVDGEKIEIENSKETLIDGYQEYEKDGKLDHAETYDIYGKISKDEHFGENGFPEKVDYYKDGKIDHTEHRNQDNKIENIEHFDKDGNLSSKDVCVYDKNGEIDYTEHRDNDNKLISVEFEHTKEENIESGINDAIKKLKDDPVVKDKGDAVADVLNKHKEDISKVFADKVSTPPDPALVSKVIVETVHNSGVDFDKKSSQIKGFLETNPIEKGIEKGFDGKNINGQQLAKDNPLKIACDEIKITSSSVGDVEKTENENTDNQKYVDIWNNLEGTEKDKIDAVGNIIDNVLQNAVDNGEIGSDQKDTVKLQMQMEMGELRNDNDSSKNAEIFADALSEINDNKEIPISADSFVQSLEIENSKEPKAITTSDTLDPINNITQDSDLQSLQDDLTVKFIEGDYDATDYLGCMMAFEGEPTDMEDGSKYNPYTSNNIIENIDERIDDSLSAIARYAEKNPDNVDQIAGAIVKIAESSTDSLCKIAEKTDTKISFTDLSEDKKTEIIEATYNKIEMAIERIYDIEVENKDVDIKEMSPDQVDKNIDEAQDQVINVVSAIVDIIVPKEDSEIKDKIEAALLDAKTCKSSNDPIEAKKAFLEKINNTLESITEKLSDHIANNDVEFDISDISQDDENTEIGEDQNDYNNDVEEDNDDDNSAID